MEVVLQCVGFCCKTQISLSYTKYISSLGNLLPHSISLGHHRVPGWASCIIQKHLTSYLFTHGVYICQCYFLYLSHSFLPHCAHKSVLCICISTPSLQIGSSTPFFQIPCITVNILNTIFVFLFLNYFTLHNRFQVHPSHSPTQNHSFYG